jgi:hypothetical protein
MLTSYDRHLTAGSATWVDRQLTPTKSPPSSFKVSGLSNTQHIDTGYSDTQKKSGTQYHQKATD